MKIAAITMVYKDYWALAQWVDHYGQLIGMENLFIFAHGKDDEVNRIANGASVITIPRDDLTAFDRTRGEVMNGLHHGLAQVYDWVIRTDADELIVTDPNIWTDFRTMFSAQQNAIFALGFDMVGDEASFTGHYSKAFATQGYPLAQHGLKLPDRKLSPEAYTLPDGVYLAHLKYADATALAAANAVRAEVANSSAKGLPGPAWKEANADADKFFRTFAAKKTVTWPDAVAEAKSLAKPVIMERASVLKTKSFRTDTKALLPDWFDC
ncbi:glycosyltransferase family 2 protein [Pseudooceanicola sp. MF1-13]|uniref:glycosyltransferase family 2 protein n=1 Tax=Pseudooceanicola sp. MF1-13 TaxID=3379095 RepID=UPI0038921959